MTVGRRTWTCPECGAPFANANASHSCICVDIDERFAAASPAVREAFDRLVSLASIDAPVTVVPQKTRVLLAAPVRFIAVHVHRDRLTGHVLADREFEHRIVADVVPNVYLSGLFLHRLSVRSANELDQAFAAFVREAAARVGRHERLATRVE